MSAPRPLAALAALVLLAGAPCLARASDVVQSQDFTYGFTDFTNAASLSFTPIPAGGFVATFTPFDASLGTLISTTVSWSVTASFSGVTGSTSSSYVASVGGTYSVGGAGYSGNGSGANLSSTTLGETLTNSFTVPQSYTFLPADAGIRYDPAIEAAFTGSSPFSATWQAGDTNAAFTANYIASGSLSVTGTASIDYNYAPVPEPPAALVLASALGLLALVVRRRAG